MEDSSSADPVRERPQRRPQALDEGRDKSGGHCWPPPRSYIRPGLRSRSSLRSSGRWSSPSGSVERSSQIPTDIPREPGRGAFIVDIEHYQRGRLTPAQSCSTLRGCRRWTLGPASRWAPQVTRGRFWCPPCCNRAGTIYLRLTFRPFPPLRPVLCSGAESS